MNNKSIEVLLSSAVSHAAPDTLDDILGACGSDKGTVFCTEKKRGSPLRRFAAVAAVLVLMIAGAFITKSFISASGGLHPQINQSGGGSVFDWLYLPLNVEVESAGKTAKLYELDASTESAKQQVERCLGIKLSDDEKQIWEDIGDHYTVGNYSVNIYSDGTWMFSLINKPATSSKLSMSDEEAIDIAVRFVEENGLWPDVSEYAQAVDQTGLLDDGEQGVYMKSVYIYPDIDGRTVLGIYRICVDISLDGEILSVFCLANPTGASTEVELKSRVDIAADILLKNYNGDLCEIESGAKIVSCDLIYYADGYMHGGKTYAFPVYCLGVEGKDSSGETVRSSILIDAQK